MRESYRVFLSRKQFIIDPKTQKFTVNCHNLASSRKLELRRTVIFGHPDAVDSWVCYTGERSGSNKHSKHNES